MQSSETIRPVSRFTGRWFQAHMSRACSGFADLSTGGGLRGCLYRRRCGRANRLSRNFESILVHIESLLPVQALDKFTHRLTDGSRKTRCIHGDRGFHGPFIPISIAKLHLKRFHVPSLPFSDHNNRSRFVHSNPVATVGTTVPFRSDDVFDSKHFSRNAWFSVL